SQHDTFVDEGVKRHEIYDYRVVMWSSTGQSDYAYVEGCTGTQGAWLVASFWFYHSSTQGTSTLLLALVCLVGALGLQPSPVLRRTLLQLLRSDSDLDRRNSLRKRPKEGMQRRASAGEAVLRRRKSSALVGRQSKLQKRAYSTQNLVATRSSVAAIHESSSAPDVVQRGLPGSAARAEEEPSTCENAEDAWAKIMAAEEDSDDQVENAGDAWAKIMADEQQLEVRSQLALIRQKALTLLRPLRSWPYSFTGSGTDTSGAATPVERQESERRVKSGLPSDSGIKSWEIDEASIKKDKLIGEGAYGQVWLGSWNSQTVAIKQFSARGPLHPSVVDEGCPALGCDETGIEGHVNMTPPSSVRGMHMFKDPPFYLGKGQPHPASCNGIQPAATHQLQRHPASCNPPAAMASNQLQRTSCTGIQPAATHQLQRHPTSRNAPAASKADGQEEDLKVLADLEREAQTLASLRHPSILSFYGVLLPTQEAPELAVVTEYCKHGTLRNFLRDASK
ncbi:hypothetical protein CYMTET_46946, partial [Cymbomonas tetramitiformis]